MKKMTTVMAILAVTSMTYIDQYAAKAKTSSSAKQQLVKEMQAQSEISSILKAHKGKSFAIGRALNKAIKIKTITKAQATVAIKSSASGLNAQEQKQALKQIK